MKPKTRRYIGFALIVIAFIFFLGVSIFGIALAAGGLYLVTKRAKR